MITTSATRRLANRIHTCFPRLNPALPYVLDVQAIHAGMTPIADRREARRIRRLPRYSARTVRQCENYRASLLVEAFRHNRSSRENPLSQLKSGDTEDVPVCDVRYWTKVHAGASKRFGHPVLLHKFQRSRIILGRVEVNRPACCEFR